MFLHTLKLAPFLAFSSSSFVQHCETLTNIFANKKRICPNKKSFLLSLAVVYPTFFPFEILSGRSHRFPTTGNVQNVPNNAWPFSFKGCSRRMYAHNVNLTLLLVNFSVFFQWEARLLFLPCALLKRDRESSGNEYTHTHAPLDIQMRALLLVL